MKKGNEKIQYRHKLPFVEALVVVHCFNRSDYYSNYDYDNFIACHDEGDGDLKFGLWIELTR